MSEVLAANFFTALFADGLENDNNSYLAGFTAASLP
jgi:hypothetical protein